jgi:hypothetical protein
MRFKLQCGTVIQQKDLKCAPVASEQWQCANNQAAWAVSRIVSAPVHLKLL